MKLKRQRQEQAAREAGEHVAGRRGVLFAETLKTLSRLTSSYRRCHWKSASELIFSFVVSAYDILHPIGLGSCTSRKPSSLLSRVGGSSMATASCGCRTFRVLMWIRWYTAEMALDEVTLLGWKEDTPCGRRDWQQLPCLRGSIWTELRRSGCGFCSVHCSHFIGRRRSWKTSTAKFNIHRGNC